MAPADSFTVIIPARNAASTIGACLDSIAALSLAPLEVIVVDDASQDDTGRIAASKGARVIREERNLGPGLARNAGAAVARGELLAFTDADCEVPADWLKRFAAAMADGDCVAVTGPYAGTTDYKLLTALIDSTLRYSQRRLPSLIESAISSNLCVRKHDFESSGGFPAYRLPWSKKCYFGNEDEELGHLLVKKTGKPIKWDRDNGVYHGYRPTVGKYLRQQAKYAEAILVSYARFPGMLSGTSNYSRGGGASKVMAALLAVFGVVVAPFSLYALIGVLPFLLVNLPCVRYVVASESAASRRAAVGLVCYPFLMLTALAWTKGLVVGAFKAAAGLVYWRRERK